MTMTPARVDNSQGPQSRACSPGLRALTGVVGARRPGVHLGHVSERSGESALVAAIQAEAGEEVFVKLHPDHVAGVDA